MNMWYWYCGGELSHTSEENDETGKPRAVWKVTRGERSYYCCDRHFGPVMAAMVVTKHPGKRVARVTVKSLGQ